MKDRISQFPGRVKLTPVAGEPNTFDLVRADQPTQEGTPINKALLDHAVAANGKTRGTGTAYLLDSDGFTLSDGAKINIKLHVASGATPTININNTGAKALMMSAVKPLKSGIAAGTWLTFTYSTTLGFFVLQGSMGGTNQKFGNEPGQISTFELCMVGHWDPFYARNIFK